MTEADSLEAKARLEFELAVRRARIRAVIELMLQERDGRAPVSTAELLAMRDEGRRF